MVEQRSFWQRIPAHVYIGVVLGGALGAFVGNALCIGYDIVNGPFGPQADVDPNPAGWAGWWIAGGAAIGATAGLVAAVSLVGLCRLISGPRQDATSR